MGLSFSKLRAAACIWPIALLSDCLARADSQAHSSRQPLAVWIHSALHPGTPPRISFLGSKGQLCLLEHERCMQIAHCRDIAIASYHRLAACHLMPRPLGMGTVCAGIQCLASLVICRPMRNWLAFDRQPRCLLHMPDASLCAQCGASGSPVNLHQNLTPLVVCRILLYSAHSSGLAYSSEESCVQPRRVSKVHHPWISSVFPSAAEAILSAICESPAWPIPHSRMYKFL